MSGRDLKEWKKKQIELITKTIQNWECHELYELILAMEKIRDYED